MLRNASRLLVLSVAGVALLASPSRAQTVFRYSNWFPPGHVLRADVIDPWIAEVERVTNGRVKIETLPKVVGSPQGQYEVVRDGLADIAVVVPGYTPGRFPLTEMLELPFLGDRAETRAPATYRFYKKHLEGYGEYRDVHVVTLMTGTAAHVCTTKVRLKKIDDFKGLKLRSPSGTTSKAVALLRGVPVAKPITEVYELASGGIIDGGIIPLDTVVGFKLGPVLPNITLVPGGVANTVTAIVINRDKWNALSKTDQEAIERVSGEAVALRSGKAHDKEEREAREAYLKAGHWVDKAGPELVAEMKNRLKALEGEWCEKARKKGVREPEKLLTALRSEIGPSEK